MQISSRRMSIEAVSNLFRLRLEEPGHPFHWERTQSSISANLELDTEDGLNEPARASPSPQRPREPAPPSPGFRSPSPSPRSLADPSSWEILTVLVMDAPPANRVVVLLTMCLRVYEMSRPGLRLRHLEDIQLTAMISDPYGNRVPHRFVQCIDHLITTPQNMYIVGTQLDSIEMVSLSHSTGHVLANLAVVREARRQRRVHGFFSDGTRYVFVAIDENDMVYYSSSYDLYDNPTHTNRICGWFLDLFCWGEEYDLDYPQTP